MIRAAIALAALLLATLPAAAGPPAQTCARPDVLDWVTRRLRERNLYAEIDARTVSEAPGATGDVVRCGVYAQVFVYDTAGNGALPLSRYEAHGYIVRTRPNGFVVLSVD